MKKTTIIKLITGTVVLAALLLFLANGMLLGYKLLGHDLDLDVRDVRIWNNFTDSQANDNTTPDPDFGGHHGAILALWKGAIEWGSEPMGGSTWGAEYLFDDWTVRFGRIYFYKLEDVGYSGVPTFHGPVSTRVGIGAVGDR